MMSLFLFLNEILFLYFQRVQYLHEGNSFKPIWKNKNCSATGSDWAYICVCMCFVREKRGKSIQFWCFLKLFYYVSNTRVNNFRNLARVFVMLSFASTPLMHSLNLHRMCLGIEILIDKYLLLVTDFQPQNCVISTTYMLRLWLL